MKTDQKAKLRVPAMRAETLTKVLGQSEQVAATRHAAFHDVLTGLRNLEIQPTVGASIGISNFAEHGTAADALVKIADAAMVRAKPDASGYAFARSEPQ